MKQALIGLAVLSLAAPHLAEADKLKVAVVPGIAVNLDAARVDALSQELADALEAVLDIDAIGGLEIRRQLPPDGIPPDCVATPACVQDVAKRVGAPQLLFVVMVDTGTGGAIQVDTTWIEASTGKTASRPAIDIASLPDAHARFVAAAPQLLPDAPVRPKPKTGPTQLGKMVPAVPRHFTTPSKITAAVSGIGIGLGIVLGIRTRSKYNTCNDHALTCNDSERDTVRNSALFADGTLLFLGVGGAVATTILYMTSSKDEHLIVEPTPTGAGGTVSWLGSF